MEVGIVGVNRHAEREENGGLKWLGRKRGGDAGLFGLHFAWGAAMHSYRMPRADVGMAHNLVGVACCDKQSDLMAFFPDIAVP